MVKKEWRVRFPKLGFQWSFRSFCIHNCFWKSGAKGLLFYFLNLRNLKSSIFYEISGFAPPSSSSMIWWSRSHDLDFKQWNIYIFEKYWWIENLKKVGYILGKIIARIVTLDMLPTLPLSIKVGCHLTKQNYLIMPCMLVVLSFFFFFFLFFFLLVVNSPHSISFYPVWCKDRI